MIDRARMLQVSRHDLGPDARSLGRGRGGRAV